MNNNQCGYRGGKSRQTTISQCNKLEYDALNGKEHIVGLFRNIRRVFDSVSYKLLVKNFKEYVEL